MFILLSTATHHRSGGDTTVNGSLESWIGKQERSRDFLSHSLVRRIAVTFGDEVPVTHSTLPHLWHWAFFQEPVGPELLGIDGHPARGMFLPPIENFNRMWAGGRLSFIEPLRIDQHAERCSVITAVKQKQGRTGKLYFVTVEHTYSQAGILCIREEQDIVYREPTSPKSSDSDQAPTMDWQDSVHPSSTMLFRYSAVTFNGHRIHYDAPYAMEQEGYPGLVVHGPMIATLLLRGFTRQYPTRIPRYFSYRGVRPLIADTDFRIGGIDQGEQCSTLHAFNDKGIAHQAEVHYKENN